MQAGENFLESSKKQSSSFQQLGTVVMDLPVQPTSSRPKKGPLPPLLGYRRHGEYLSDIFYEEPVLYNTQKEALKSVVRWFSDDKTKDYTAVVSMPTGTGKTAVICCLPYCLGGAADTISCIDFTKPILVIAPGLSILDQLKENLDTNPFLMRSHINLIKPGEEHCGCTMRSVNSTADVRALKTSSRYDIVLSNAQKWRRKDKTNPVPNYEDLQNNLFSIIIVDEAHHLPANQWQEIINKFKDHAKVVFFTATPYRADGVPITADLAIQEVGLAYELTRERAIEEKQIRELAWDLGQEESAIPPAKKRKRSKYEDGEKNESSKKVLTKVKKCLDEKSKKFPLPGGKKHTAIIISSSIMEAEEIFQTLKELFKPESVALCHSKQKNNQKIIKDILKDKYRVVVVVKMLVEGFDYPPFSIAGIVTRIGSITKFSQFVGRIQRLVRTKDEIEKDIVADVISHENFKQEGLKEKYLKPRIPTKRDEEDKSLDAELDQKPHAAIGPTED